MTDVIEAAPSGRAKCRGCGLAIEKGSLRFGETVPNAYGDGESRLWFHPACAACMRPEKFLATIAGYPGEFPDKAVLEALAQAGVRFPRLSRISRLERAPSGRAHCRHCKELMEKGSWRIALQLLEESRFQPIGFIHLTCASLYVTPAEETPDVHPPVADVLARLTRFTPDLSPTEWQEIERLLTPVGA